LILKHYISNTFLKSFAVICISISLIIALNQFIYISKSIDLSVLFSNELLYLIIYRFFSNTTLVINFSTIISIVFVLNRLSNNSELTILLAASISREKVLVFFSKILFFIFFISLSNSLIIQPKFRTQYLDLLESVQNRPDYTNLKSNTFQEFNDQKISIYIESIANKDRNQLLEKIMIFNKEDNSIITAQSGVKKIDKNNKIILDLFNGKIYKNLELNNNINISKFEEYSVFLHRIDENLLSQHHNSDAESLTIIDLIKTQSFENKLELLSRINVFISFMLISFYVGIMSYPTKRTSFKIHPVFVGILLFSFSYYLSEASLQMVESSSINFYQGFMLVNLSILLIILFLKKINGDFAK